MEAGYPNMHLVDQAKAASGFTAPVLVGDSPGLQRVRLLAELQQSDTHVVDGFHAVKFEDTECLS